MTSKIFNNPLTISFLIYIFIVFIIYVKYPNLFKKYDPNDETTTDEQNNFLTRNACIIFIILPILIYGSICGLNSYKNRKEYCALLKNKELNLKEVLEQCKSK
jgi:hypothetical protein